MKRGLIALLLVVAVATAVPLAGQVVPRLSGAPPAGSTMPSTAGQSPGTGSQEPGRQPPNKAAGPVLASPGALGPSSGTSPAGKAAGGTSPAGKESALSPSTAGPKSAKESSGGTSAAARPAAGKEPTSDKSAGKTLAAPGKSAEQRAVPVGTASGTGSSSRRELVIENALVMLIDDNKVPATETGMLTAVHVKEGHSVEKGTLLAEIDSRATLAKQRVAQGELAAALAQAENDAEVEVARHAIEVAKADLDANTEIRRTNKAAVSEAEHRKFVFQYQRSLAQEKQAINEKEIARLTATAKQAQLDATTVELELRQIRAPFDGQVVEIMKNVGDWVTAGEPIMHVVGLKRVRVKGFVPAHLATHQEVLGKPVTITVFSGGQREFSLRGTIGFASPVIEGLGTSRQFRIWAEVDNEQSIDPVTGQAAWKIQPGSVAKMVIDLTASGRAAAAPASPPPAAVSATASTGEGTKVQSLRPVTDGPQAGRPAALNPAGADSPSAPRQPRER